MEPVIPQDLLSEAGVGDINSILPPELTSLFSDSVGSSIGEQEITQNLQAISPEATAPVTPAPVTPAPVGEHSVDAVLADAVADVRTLEQSDPVVPALANDLEAALLQTFGGTSAE